MKELFVGIYLLAIMGCSSWSVPQSYAVDGAPAEIETSTFTEGYVAVPPQRLFEWGIEASALDALDGEYAFQFSFHEDLQAAINNEAVAVHFSLWTSEGDFALGMPQLDKEDMTFWMVAGYKLRVMLEVKTSYRGLKKGVGYFAELDPREHVTED